MRRPRLPGLVAERSADLAPVPVGDGEAGRSGTSTDRPGSGVPGAARIGEDRPGA
ncbi:hypothetical protein ACFPN0_01650 [Kitasatospora cinereorecta]